MFPRHLCLLFSLAIILLADDSPAQEPTFDHRKAAEEILKDSNHDDVRSKVADESLPHAARVIAAMTENLPNNLEEEYRRIPWIWRLAINATKQGNAEQQRALLILSLPERDKPLAHWQAVVLGGGLINGLSQLGENPTEQIQKLLMANAGSGEDQQRFARTIELAVKMVDDQSVPSGTRYDALRILGASDWNSHAEQLVRYLASDTDEELQMGAVSATADLANEAATKTLIQSLAKISPDNRNLALEMLLSRQPQRGLLKKSVSDSTIPRQWLTAEQLKQLDK
jgi:hypothetical protein